MKPRIARKYDEARYGGALISLALPGVGHWLIGYKVWAVVWFMGAVFMWWTQPGLMSLSSIMFHVGCAVHCLHSFPRI